MARIDTVGESHGPDRFNMHPGCVSHHAGVKTGIKDYCCCCDPCQYVRKSESASQPDDRHCCRCNPRLILAKFTATNGNECCRNSVVPMLVQLAAVNGQEVMKYTGTIVGHIVTVYLSKGPIGSYGDADDMLCRWTIQIPTLGIDQEIEIDHTTVTCLGVPAISVTGVTAYDGCIGTVSLINYKTVKVPFRTRYSPGSEVSESIIVPFPEGFEPENCDSLPRYLCITKKHNRINRVRSPKIPWEIEWARVFQWDAEFEPVFDDFNQEWILGCWVHDPDDTTAFQQRLYLIQNLYGETFLQPDFESPARTDGDGETYQRVPLTSCGCDFKILDVRPVDDPSPPTVPGQSISSDLLGIDYRGGRCGCWDYHCGKRRCVPKHLCGFVYVNETLYRNILFTWDNSLKCWVSSGGVDLEDGEMPFELRICLTQNNEGQCQLVVTHEDYELSAVVIGDTETVLSGTIEGTNYARTDYFSLNFTTSFDGDCELLLTCVVATPCYVDCGSHPQTLNLTLRGWSLPTDYPPPPVTGGCSLEITLNYFQSVVVSGSGILFTCGYVGYATVTSPYYDAETETTQTGTFVIKAELSLGGLRIYRKLVSDPSFSTPIKSVGLQTETCNPYYGYYFTLSSLHSCFFGDTSIIFMRWEAEIVE